MAEFSENAPVHGLLPWLKSFPNFQELGNCILLKEMFTAYSNILFLDEYIQK